MDRPWRTSDFNEWLALSRMAVQNLLGRAERWGTIKGFVGVRDVVELFFLDSHAS